MRSVAIVGSGPSGLFLAKYINRSINNNVKLDIFEKLNYPFGLLKFGVAPDHLEVKVHGLDAEIFCSNQPRKNLWLTSNHYSRVQMYLYI